MKLRQPALVVRCQIQPHGKDNLPVERTRSRKTTMSVVLFFLKEEKVMSKKKKNAIEIDWYGNGGYCFPDPGTKESIECGVCGTKMNVIGRNILGPTSWAESVARSKHLHDSFECPYLHRNWHKRIRQLKVDVYLAEIDDRGDKKQIKKKAKKKIIKILTKHLKS